VTRVLILGDTAGTGFGTVTRDLASAMVRRGDDVRIVSMNEDAGYQTDPGFPKNLRDRVIILGHDDGWLALGAMSDEGQSERLKLLAQARGVFTGDTVPGWKPDGVVIIGDVASLKLSPWPAMLPDDMPAWNYVPVEGIDLPPRWRHLWDRIAPVAMCEFGADQIEKLMPTRPPVVYHGVDGSDFFPVSEQRPLVLRTGRNKLVRLRSKTECRQFLGWPLNATVAFRADRHMPRKNYASLFRAMAPVLAKHRDAWLIWHCRSIDQGGDLVDEASKYPDFIAARMASTGFHDTVGGVDRKMLAAMYNAADVYVTTSAEGFGLTIAEALACGVPVVGLDYSSVPEVIGPAGITVPVVLQDNPYSYFWAAPVQARFTEAVERLVVDRDERRRLGALGPQHVARFSWEAAAEQFSAIVAGAEAPAAPPIPVDRRMAALGLVGARQ
jgi:glycosyltransferase involved in cell wall biosynthesis